METIVGRLHFLLDTALCIICIDNVQRFPGLVSSCGVSGSIMSFWVVFVQTNSGQLSSKSMASNVGEDSDDGVVFGVSLAEE